MPLRDHFRPPVSKQASWQGFHGLWPAMMVLQLSPKMPPGFQIEPRANLGAFYEIDVCAFDRDVGPVGASLDRQSIDDGGGTALATWAPPRPSVDVEAEFDEEYAYEVLFFDVQEEERRLVAAIEIVSPANKDRPLSRQLFIAKCANLLAQDVCVSIVDLVTNRHFNLYVELLTLLRQRDPAFEADPPDAYAATCRKQVVAGKSRLRTWSHRLAIGQSPPTQLPIWLRDDLPISLDLEASYEAACQPIGIK